MMSKNNLKYHERLPCWPDFAFPTNEIDGLLPSCRVENWEHFMESMRSPHRYGIKQDMIYRGQRRYDWGLSSTLSREYDEGRIKDEDRKSLLEKFKLAMRGRGPDFKNLDENEIWAYGQHNGLFTPLLDWSRSPFVALYFAFVEPDDDREEENTSRSIFCLNMSPFMETMSNIFYEPITNENARLVNQAGLFTITPFGQENFVSYIIENLREHGVISFDTFEDKPTSKDEVEYYADETAYQISQYVCKIHIPNIPKDREKCLDMLRQMNIHHGSLFPDPLGAAIYTKDWLRRKIVQEREELREKEKRRLEETKISLVSSEFYLSTSSASLIDRIKNTIRLTIDESVASNETVLDWASKIANRYDYIKATDWPIRPAARAKIHTNILRQISLLGAGSLSQELTKKLVDVLDADYRSKHSLNFDGRGDEI